MKHMLTYKSVPNSAEVQIKHGEDIAVEICRDNEAPPLDAWM